MSAAVSNLLDDGRFSRQELITWWDQRVLAAARVLVVGAGALGNEILKNLALLGVGNVFVVDLDLIETSNLSRTILFRERDLGRPKARVAAEAVRDIFPEGRVQAFHGNVVYDLGLGVFDWADVVVCGLDNREARLEVNRACWKTGTPWIDGAIEGLEGQVRMFEPPASACYECTMSSLDWKLLETRRSCALLSRGERALGRVPTVATTASAIAALQCQEVVKWLHGISDLAGQGLVLQGRTGELHRVVYQRREVCYSHATFGPRVPLGARVCELRVGELVDRASSRLGGPAVIDLNRDALRELECPACGTREPVFQSLGRITEDAARCPACAVVRIAHPLSVLDADCGVADRTLAEIGVPPFEILSARCGEREVAFVFDGDAAATLGDLARAN